LEKRNDNLLRIPVSIDTDNTLVRNKTPTKDKTMPSIRDKNGNAISTSKNLAGIRKYVGGYMPPFIKTLDVSEIGDYEGKLSILFDNGNSYETNFESYNVLINFVSRWRNVHGAPLTLNGQNVGEVSSTNPTKSVL
jgi:hypothetical protein